MALEHRTVGGAYQDHLFSWQHPPQMAMRGGPPPEQPLLGFSHLQGRTLFMRNNPYLHILLQPAPFNKSIAYVSKLQWAYQGKFHFHLACPSASKHLSPRHREGCMDGSDSDLLHPKLWLDIAIKRRNIGSYHQHHHHHVLPESQEEFPPCHKSLDQSMIPALVLHLAPCNTAIWAIRSQQYSTKILREHVCEIAEKTPQQCFEGNSFFQFWQNQNWHDNKCNHNLYHCCTYLSENARKPGNQPSQDSKTGKGERSKSIQPFT